VRRLEELHLNGNDLTSLAGIGKLARLRLLDVSYNQLTSLPPDLTKLRALDELRISCKASPRFKNLAAELRKLQKLPALRKLFLINVGLRVFPDELCALPLTHLTLNHNDLKRLPDDLGKLARLEYLKLHGNPIEPAEKTRLKKLLPRASLIF
jgi:Leucine-rich repeat (LRR) protein